MAGNQFQQLRLPLTLQYDYSFHPSIKDLLRSVVVSCADNDGIHTRPAMAPRHDLVSSAVTFLQDPSVASSPVEKRIEFLRSKNLTPEEIDLALSQSSGEAPPPTSTNQAYYPPPQQYRPPPQGYAYPPYGQQWPQQPPPEPPRRDWRDYFIMATVVGGASYGLYVLANRYIRPLIAPPTPPQLEQDKAAIDEQFNKAFALIDTLTEDTTKLKEAEEARTKRLDTAIADIETIVADLKAANTRREDDSRRMETEIKNMRDSLPRAIDTVKEGSEKQLKELSTELSSLKALMSNRMGSNPSSSYGSASIPRVPKADTVPAPYSNPSRPSNVGTPTTEVAPGSLGNVTGVNGAGTIPSYSMPSTSGTSTPNAGASNAKPATTNLGYGAKNVSIPAWQLAAQNKKDGAAAAGSSTTNGTPTVDGADAVAALQAS
ncbi:peroxisomal membrane protein pex14 [Neophaeococcomyces mojaviensis]|uniref:Peroxisomal membrane protein pex14 n=1 Tax=Neophaeococcomyces mojaviensis TaxID=3383035 RepID=A0ACC3AJH2_9EURO|nr:peroxisomal membrane protein pex14 [Knufia sp. JES_112]